MHLAFQTANSFGLSETSGLLLGLSALAVTWFLVNTLTVGIAVALSTGQGILAVLADSSGLSLLNSTVSASAAGLIIPFYEESYLVFLLSLPIAAVLYKLYSFYIEKYEGAQRHITELHKLYLQTVEALASAVDAKDRYTHGHIRRVQVYAVELSKQMGLNDERDLMAMKSGALLHDIGKIAIPEYILNKPTVLTESEFEKMKIHPAIGAEMLKGIEFPFPVEPLVKFHHERWDGKGYPEGLAGEEIPLSARILSLVDCYDALTTNRPYRSPMGRDEVIEFFKRESGRAYDPGVVEAFVANIELLEREAEKVTPPTVDIWGSEAAHQKASENLRPLEKVQPTVNYSQAMKVDKTAQRELYSIFEFVRSVRTLQRKDILTFIGAKLEGLIQFDTGVFYALVPDEAAVKPEHVIGPKQESINRESLLSLDQKLSGWVAANNQSLANLPPFPDFQNVGEPKPHFEVSAIAPMVHQGNVLGSLALYRTEKIKFTDQEFRHLEIIAGQTAAALDRTPQGQDSEAALFDELTGLPNGYQLFLMFDQVAMDAQRYEYPLALLSFRIENLAEIRRRYGHLSSNDLLGFVARHFGKQIRESDILVRYSEDQFLTLHPKMTREKAEAFKSRVQEELDHHRMPVRQGVEVSPQVSVGIAEFPQEGTKLEDLLSIAEWRLNDDQHLRAAAKRTLRFPT